MGANEDLYDATIRHQVQLLRYSKGQATSVAKLLAEADAELVAKIAGGLTEVSEARLKALLVDVRKLRAAAMERVSGELKKDMTELAGNEASWEMEAIQASVPAELKLNSVSPATMKALTGKPINGVPLDGWVGTMASGDISRIEQQLRLGVSQGETLDQLVRRIRGSKANGYADGVVSMTTRNAQTIARTAVNHVSNTARQEVWNANSDIIRGVRWCATLDGRTSDVCRGRDGHEYPIDQGPRPPGHPGCRSTTTPILAGDRIVGDRPFVRDTRTRKARETDFRTEAQSAAGEKWKGMTAGQRTEAIKAQRTKWVAENIGQVPSSTTYDSWMRKQPQAFQDEVLGKAKAEMFRGGMTLDKFVDEKGKSYTIDQLKAQTSGDKLFVQQPGVGMKAKALLQQGLPADKVLEAIKAEYPDASTSLASIASYKTELKKAGVLDVPTGIAPSSIMKKAQSVADVVAHVESQLPAGAKHAIGGQWASVVEDLEGGAYGYYQAGKGVLLSGKKLSAISSVQAQQVASHELGHLLHKQHGLALTSADVGDMMIAAESMEPAQKKLYGYYLASLDELTAEVYAQAISPSMMTSQGLSAVEFNTTFSSSIAKAKQALQDKFPAPHVHAPPPPVGAPSVPFEVAGKHTTVGGLAKALLQQGLPDDKVLEAVLAEFPNAKTSKASLASYKVELKKGGLLPAKGPGVVVQAKPLPEAVGAPPVTPKPPPVAAAAKAVDGGPPPELHGMVLGEDQLDAVAEAKKYMTQKMAGGMTEAAAQAEAFDMLHGEFYYSAKDAKGMADLAAWELKQVEVTNAAHSVPLGKVPELAGTKLTKLSQGHLDTIKASLSASTDGYTGYAKDYLAKQGYSPKQIGQMVELAQYQNLQAKALQKPYLAAANTPAAAVPPPPKWLDKKLTTTDKMDLYDVKALMANGKSPNDVVDYLMKNKGYTGDWAGNLVDLAKYQMGPVAAPAATSKVLPEVMALKDGPKPKLHSASLGPISSKLLKPLEEAILAGESDQVLHGIMSDTYGMAYKKEAGQDLIDLAKYDVANGQKKLNEVVPAPSSGGVKYKAKTVPLLTPSRVAATPREGIPPPPRFTKEQRREGIEYYAGHVESSVMSKMNKRQKELGLELLTEEEAGAIRSYTGNTYATLNTALRGGEYAGNTALQAYVEAAQHGLEKMPKFTGDTSRGLNMSAKALEQALSTYTPGAIVEEHAFISTSTGDRAAFSGNMFMKIKSKTGVLVQDFSKFTGEREVLYKPGTRLRVISVRKDPGAYIVEMEEV
jgi:SPP1 gp7 family putative phage head morphogenesis protein